MDPYIICNSVLDRDFEDLKSISPRSGFDANAQNGYNILSHGSLLSNYMLFHTYDGHQTQAYHYYICSK